MCWHREGICPSDKIRKDLAAAEQRAEEAEQWVHDLQAGMYINCVYCGHRYGPDDEVPATMADALKEHIEQCSKHPMSALKADLAEAQEALRTTAQKLHHTEEHMLAFEDCYAATCIDARAALPKP